MMFFMIYVVGFLVTILCFDLWNWRERGEPAPRSPMVAALWPLFLLAIAVLAIGDVFGAIFDLLLKETP